MLQTLYLSLPPHLILPFSWIILFLPPYYPLPLAAVHRQSPLSVCTRFPHPLLAQSAAHLDVACTRHLPASAACICTPRCMPTPVAVSGECAPPPPPFGTLGLNPGPCQPLGGLSVAGPSVSNVPPPRPP